MDHPPIPPNCKDFMLWDGKPAFRDVDLIFCPIEVLVSAASHVDSENPSDLETPGKFACYYRRIIAAVAEVAWLREADRRETEMLMHQGGDDKYAQMGIMDARDNAAAWRKWGLR